MGSVSSSSSGGGGGFSPKSVILSLSLTIWIPAAYFACALVWSFCIEPIVRSVEERLHDRETRRIVSWACTEADATFPHTHAHENQPTDGNSNTHERIHRLSWEQHSRAHVNSHQNQAMSSSPNILGANNRTNSYRERCSSYSQQGLRSVRTVARPSRTHALPHCGAEDIDRLREVLPRVKAPRPNKDNCTVCIEPLGERLIIQCPSFHPVHSSCLMSWMKISKKCSCPVCRTNLLDTVGV